MRNAFTLIELVIVLLILANLALVAIPAFQTLSDRARNSTVKSILGGMRSAITLYRANEVTQGRPASYPSGVQMMDVTQNSTGPKPMENGDVPANPWCGFIGGNHCLNDEDSLTFSPPGDPARTVDTSHSAGWIYNETTGLIYANTNANGGGACGASNPAENCY